MSRVVHEADVAVIGGGLVGAAIAWGLARDGTRVAVLDEGDVAFRASRGNFALVWVQSKGLGMPEYAAWTKRSSDLWGEFARQLNEQTGLDVAFRRPGGFHLCLSERELENRAEAQRGAHLGGAPRDDAGRLSHLSAIRKLPRRIRRHLPQRRDLGGKPRAGARAPDCQGRAAGG
jgi:glycine/D-amino acid oxidase-like deaminating enzyme